MPRSEMKVALVRHTLNPEEVVALGARLCYSKARVDDLLERVEQMWELMLPGVVAPSLAGRADELARFSLA